MYIYELKTDERIYKTLKANQIELLNYFNYDYQQFKSCQAWFYKGEAMNATTGELLKIDLLQSYNTLVAAIVNGVLYRGKFSSTTSKQITQWARNYSINKTINF